MKQMRSIPEGKNKMHISNLSILAYSRGMTFWFYTHNGPTQDISCVRNECVDSTDTSMIRPGDVILISGTDGVAMRYVNTNQQLLKML